MKIAFSPCPNDTFVFHAWAHGLLPDAPALEITYADIDKTNHWAIDHTGPEVMKISYAALPYVLDNYALIPCGGALGRGCGPLLLTKDALPPEATKAAKSAYLSGKTIAVPSDRSTAYLLFRLWLEQLQPEVAPKIIVMPFNDIMPAVQSREIDAGLVIHEARFTYHQYQLSQLVDLGSWWEQDTGLPIPLGAIIARRDQDLQAIAAWVRQSVRYAWDHPLASQEYVMSHAQEMDLEVAKSHIDLYVNSFTDDLGEEGLHAISSLLTRAAAAGLVPAFKPDQLK